MYSILQEMHCVFCDIITKKAPAYIVYEDAQTIAFLDKYPQSRGHIQLVPKAHYRWIYEIKTIREFFATAQQISRGIIPVLGADHISWGTFGNEIEHAHLWIIPRYKKQQSAVAEGAGKSVQAEELKALGRTLSQALRGEVSHVS